MIETINFLAELPFAVTVCDTDGIIVYMNQKSQATFSGADELIGKSLYDCHNENSCRIIREILATGIPNSYTIEKKGKKKLIHQSPWYEDGKLSGLVEISIEIPFEMAHFFRDAK
jgi:transcriptional regulator with PAS, ATPase and Fis domain